jgi:hypothetical protein
LRSRQLLVDLAVTAPHEDWNLITRIIQPLIYQDELFPGLGSKFGLGDMTPTFFFSPDVSNTFLQPFLAYNTKTG